MTCSINRFLQFQKSKISNTVNGQNNGSKIIVIKYLKYVLLFHSFVYAFCVNIDIKLKRKMLRDMSLNSCPSKPKSLPG